MKVPNSPPTWVEDDSTLVNDTASQEYGAGENRKTKPHVVTIWHQRVPVAHVISIGIHHNGAGQNYLNIRMLLKELAYRLERAGEVLLVTVKICENVALGTLIPAIDRFVHAIIFFDKRPNAGIVWQPVLRAIVRTCVLNNVFELDALLIGDRRDTELEPGRMAETGRDDRESQILSLTKACQK